MESARLDRIARQRGLRIDWGGDEFRVAPEGFHAGATSNVSSAR
jgi:hypothetical protein